MNKPKVDVVCEQVVEALVSQGYTYQVTREDIAKVIYLIRGIDERTVARWLHVLEAFHYLIVESSKTYRINPAKIPHIVHKLKEQPQVMLSGVARTHTQSSEAHEAGR